ncbi:MAG TPA: cytochrome-c oxidase, cbb3-type subunit III [Pseudomonadales bacterium]|nr:cytochrome-c oxidase, cbb3-type subunit III [Pseudomonadales bacterium]
MSSFVSWFIIIGTLGSLLGVFLLLWLNKNVSRPGQTTGHSYDGIQEYDNPLPAWWFWWFILTIVFGLGYLVWYPGLGNFKGVGGWTSVKQLEHDQALAKAKYGPIFAQYRDVPVDQLAQDPEAHKMGRRLFTINCSQCHGATATGSFGFPNLTDDEWMWGGSGVQIETTISGGRQAAMPAWGPVLGDTGVNEVASYVMSLSGRQVDPAVAGKGEALFKTYCVTCHGPDGKGNALFGAPNLTNEIWLYGNSKQQIEHTIKNGRNGQMPTFKNKLGEDKVHILAAYVKSLSSKPSPDS